MRKKAIKIRKATKKDLMGILKVILESSVLNPADKGNKKLKEYILFSLKDKNMLTLISEVDKEIASVAICKLRSLKNEDAILLDIYVLKSFRNKGVGKKLMKELENILKKKGIKNLGLYSENSLKTLNFYKKEGFEIGRLIRRCDKKLK